jgi:Cys-tRNA(Pro)/Cys-tRNA(Cys) deacylase
MKKTNAVRILDRLKLAYQLRVFAVEESDSSAEKAAELLGVPVNQIFKTLVARGDKNSVIVVSISGGSELDLKALAKNSGNKKVEMVNLKEVQPLTGYIRGAVSPLGMKHSYPYFLDEKAFLFPSVVISAGKRGIQISLTPQDLAAATGAIICKIAR